MTQRFFTLFASLALLFASCKSESNDFQLKSSVDLSEYGLISPFYIEQLVESPIRQFHGWNDSLLKICNVKEIKIIAHGMKNPDAEAELASYHFTSNGKINQYRYFKYELSEDPFTQINYRNQVGSIKTYFGEQVNQSIQTENSNQLYSQLWSRGKGSDELLKIIGSKEKPVLLLSYSGDRLSKCTVVLHEKKPLRTIVEILKDNEIAIEDLTFADKAVLYVDDKYMPLEMYQFNEDFIQTSLLAQWVYENHKKLTAYRRYINGTCVKEFTFAYSDQRLLTSFEYNRVRYSVLYN
jgi:hypothetical protein